MPLNHGNKFTFDHCGCSVNVAFDDTLPPDQRVLVYITQQQWRDIFVATNGVQPTTDQVTTTTEMLCPNHKSFSGNPQSWAIPLEENQRKNITHGRILAFCSGHSIPIPQDILTSVMPYVSWSGSAPNRGLNIALSSMFPNITSGQLATVQNDLNNVFASGRVLVH